ncbi:hypothetical protein PR048_011623 [Dryococelus australis]|uniref:CCHC-type domain-containing protein n=1 Tax=Dryococelus australis TaxID=614101 RepID=A0ABQ9HMV3_9NEOP|nr:hypothetical protein PR048_011623 [Dryococelus australis]
MMKLNTEIKVQITDNPEIIVGPKIENARGFINIHQESYMDQLLNIYNMDCTKPITTPAVSGTDNSEDCNGMEGVNFPYRKDVGSLLYLSNRSRPDITYAVTIGSSKVENPTVHDVKKFKWIFRYLQGTRNLRLRYSADLNTSLIDAYSDADYADDGTPCRSTSGDVILYMGSPVAWSTRKQPIISLSTAESEFIATSECVKKVLFLKSLYKELTEEALNKILTGGKNYAQAVESREDQFCGPDRVPAEIRYVDNRRCQYCRKPNHTARNRFQRKSAVVQKLECYREKFKGEVKCRKCGRNGHKTVDCHVPECGKLKRCCTDGGQVSHTPRRDHLTANGGGSEAADGMKYLLLYAATKQTKVESIMAL